MQITIKQAEVEEALRHHLSRMGITGEIQEVSSTQSRSEGQLITNIEVGTKDLQDGFGVEALKITEDKVSVTKSAGPAVPAAAVASKVEADVSAKDAAAETESGISEKTPPKVEKLNPDAAPKNRNSLFS